MKRKEDFPIKLIIVGFVLLSIGAVLAGSISYQLSMREKIPIIVDLSNKNESIYELPPDLSMKTFYNFSYKGERYVNLSVIFLGEDSSEVGSLTILDASRNNSGYLYLDDKPKTLLIRNSCSKCNTTLFLTFFFARYNSLLVNLETILATIVSVIGAVSLLMGGYLYVAYKNLGKS